MSPMRRACAALKVPLPIVHGSDDPSDADLRKVMERKYGGEVVIALYSVLVYIERENPTIVDVIEGSMRAVAESSQPGRTQVSKEMTGLLAWLAWTWRSEEGCVTLSEIDEINVWFF